MVGLDFRAPGIRECVTGSTRKWKRGGWSPKPSLLLASCAPWRLTTLPGSASPGENLIKVTMEMETYHSTPSVTCVCGVCTKRDLKFWRVRLWNLWLCNRLQTPSSYFFPSFYFKLIFLAIKYTSQSRESMRRTEQRLHPTQRCTLPNQELDSDYLILMSPWTLVCVMINVGDIPNSHESMVFAYLLKQVHQTV